MNPSQATSAATASFTARPVPDAANRIENPALEAAYAQAIAGTPEWLRQRRAAAWEQWSLLPLTPRRDERWRFTQFPATDFAAAVPGRPAREATDAEHHESWCTERAGLLVVANDSAVRTELDPVLAAQGVVFCSISEALAKHSRLLETHFLTEAPGLGADKLMGLHGALAREGAFLHVPEGVSIGRPFVVFNLASGAGQVLMPHTLVVTGEGASCSLLDIFASDDAGSANLVVASAALHAGKDSTLVYKAVQDWNLATKAFHLNTANAAEGARITSVNVNLGADYMRHEHHTRLLGSGSDINTYSLSVPTGTQQVDQRTLQTHYAPGARSDLLFKNAISGKGRTIFSGLIKVEPGAQQTDAYQTNRNLLLSDDAEANSLPGLEIAANDVKCSHGATSGQLDESEIFYMLARGMTRAAARRLLAFGFLEEILEKLDIESVAEHIRERVARKLTTI